MSEKPGSDLHHLMRVQAGLLRLSAALESATPVVVEEADQIEQLANRFVR
ncbi:MAG: hypothetical protein ACRD96_06025 [Bryobacteraceae bacterium]